MRGPETAADRPKRKRGRPATAEAPGAEITMPPYNPVVSKAQGKKMFALAERGDISEDEARGKVRAANWKSLPERKMKRKGSSRGKRMPFRSKR